MKRLTKTNWRNLDGCDCCGQDMYCQRDGNEFGGCHNGCIIPKLYERLAQYEDIGLSPKEISQMKTDFEEMDEYEQMLP